MNLWKGIVSTMSILFMIFGVIGALKVSKYLILLTTLGIVLQTIIAGAD
jgi:hypothetical protein